MWGYWALLTTPIDAIPDLSDNPSSSLPAGRVARRRRRKTRSRRGAGSVAAILRSRPRRVNWTRPDNSTARTFEPIVKALPARLPEPIAFQVLAFRAGLAHTGDVHGVGGDALFAVRAVLL